MFYYFGYGSNINLVSLRAKGVEPIDSVPGIIHGWKLRFNVQHWFRHEGGVGNIERSDDPLDVVEGLLHQCEDSQLQSLDAMEAYGIGYDRILVNVESGKGTVAAYAYIGLPEYINDACLPSRRYLNIIISGAVSAGLNTSYIDRLRQHPVHLPDNYPDFIYPVENDIVFNAYTLLQYPELTALAGAVFDMSGARKQLESLASLVSGKDMTVFYLKRLDTSSGRETLEDYLQGNLSGEAKKYLNMYLQEYNREFRYVGRFDYTSDDQ